MAAGRRLEKLQRQRAVSLRQHHFLVIHERYDFMAYMSMSMSMSRPMSLAEFTTSIDKSVKREKSYRANSLKVVFFVFPLSATAGPVAA